ncbi:helix-turn-helix transcriptional regulator [Pseudobythopirellula maris]|uniref:helix-turn-helix transcriptional regulator n=1 Tax=Pseudobythopirellula maris TaxID=2527991 RepID=UPI0018D3CEE9|nr:helix-turn-helix transcriptional regulator [Pseudobythopirellula maris]
MNCTNCSETLADAGDVIDFLGAAMLCGSTTTIRLASFAQDALGWLPDRAFLHGHAFNRDESGLWSSSQKFLVSHSKAVEAFQAISGSPAYVEALTPVFGWGERSLANGAMQPVVATAVEAVGAERLYASELGRLRREAGIEDVLTAAWKVDEGKYLLIGLGRELDSSPYSDDERCKLRLLARGMAPILKGGASHASKGVSLSKAYNLTKAEAEVLEHALRGLTEKQIAEQLDRSHHTIHSHLKRIYKRFGVTSRAELLALALEG